MWWLMPTTSALQRLRQEGWYRFKDSLGCRRKRKKIRQGGRERGKEKNYAWEERRKNESQKHSSTEEEVSQTSYIKEASDWHPCPKDKPTVFTRLEFHWGSWCNNVFTVTCQHWKRNPFYYSLCLRGP